MDIKIRKATVEDSDSIFSLVENFATSFTPEKDAFDHSLEQLLSDDSVLMNVAVIEKKTSATASPSTITLFMQTVASHGLRKL